MNKRVTLYDMLMNGVGASFKPAPYRVDPFTYPNGDPGLAAYMLNGTTFIYGYSDGFPKLVGMTNNGKLVAIVDDINENINRLILGGLVANEAVLVANELTAS